MSTTRVGTLVAGGSTGNESVTGIGFTPCAVFFFWNPSVTVEDAFGVDIHLSIGAADGTNQWAQMLYMQDAAAAPTIASHEHAIGCLMSELGQGAAEFVSLDADGFTIDWTTAPAAGQIVYFIAWNADDFEAAVGDLTLPSFSGSTTVSGLAFEPTSLLLAGGENLGGAQGRFSLGFAVQTGDQAAPSGSIQNFLAVSLFRVVGVGFGRSVAPFAAGGSSVSIAGSTALGAVAPSDQIYSLSAWNADGFEVTAETTSTPRTMPGKYLALRKIDNPDSSRNDIQRGNTTSSPWPTPGINPLSGMFLEAAIGQGTASARVGIGAVDDDLNQRSVWSGMQNTGGTSQANSLSSSADAIAGVDPATPSVDVLTSVTAWGAEEFTTTDDAGAGSTRYLALLWGSVAAAGFVPQIFRRLIVRR